MIQHSMKNTLSALLILIAGWQLSAQTTTPPVICGNEVFSHMLRQHHPALDAAIRSTFEATQAASGSVSERGNAPTINVVVHIVWKNPEENLADSIILDQIAVLNRDFNRENADTSDLRDVFVPAAGNPQIRFNLAHVERVQTDKLFEISLFGNNLLEEVKHSDQGGSDAWNTENYLNIWICKIQPLSFGGITAGQILGFAFPPAGLANWPAGSNAPAPDEDGVVLDFRVIGSNNPNTIEIPGSTDFLTVKGRTAVHEVGHYLGLRHIWGDGGILGLPNDCQQSDGIDDTPYANAQSAFDCDKTRNTCPTVETFYTEDVPDLVENYMDYSRENCQNMFTKGQAAHMNSTLNGPRSGLLATPSSVKNLSENMAWNIAPNPAGARVTVTVETFRPNEIFELRLIDATGHTLMQRQITARQTAIDTGHLDNGIYFLQLHTPKGLSTHRVVVQR
jgi:hypothetical protein